MHYHFEWDPAKAARNLKKHGVSFELATEVFRDPIALTVYDDDSGDEEERWITLGQVQQQHYLVVVHTSHDINTKAVRVRLISARSASKREVKQYEQG